MNRRDVRASKAVGRRKMKLGWTPFEPGPMPTSVKHAVGSVHNSQYVVIIARVPTSIGIVDRMIIRRNDGSTRVPWAHKQRIKNEVFGKGRTAVEVFPSERDLVDDANCYHLWVLPVGYDLPFKLTKSGDAC